MNGLVSDQGLTVARSRALKRLAVMALSLGFAACSHGPRRPEPPPEVADQESLAAKGQAVRTDLIREVINKGQYYAALAHIDEQKAAYGDSPELRLLEADTRRNLGQKTQAEALYRSLLAGPQAGQAYHGLGLVCAAGGDREGAIRNLRFAAGRLPTDVEIRNDLGYALMEAGRYTEAVPELSTAAELAPNQRKSRNNLIILMVLMGNEPAASRLAQQIGAGPDQMRKLRDEAQDIRRKATG
jgi:Flp pilus assembly protein TadD